MKIHSVFRILCGCFCFLFLLCACSGTAKFTVREDGRLYDRKSKQFYSPAPSYYHAYSYNTTDTVGVYTERDGTVRNLYRITGSGNYLCDEDCSVYLPEGVDLPAPEQMNVTRIDFCRGTYSVMTYSDPERITEILETMRGVAISYERIPKSADTNYQMLFADIALGLVLELEYLVYEEPVLIYEPLNGDGSAPDLYGVAPHLVEVNGEQVAVYDLGTQLILNRIAGVCFVTPDLL